jgi:hypothetical protein
MTFSAYATPQDVYDLGFGAAAFVVVPRPWKPEDRKGDAIDIATGTIRMAGHGYSADDLVEFVLVGAGSVPGGVAAGAVYSPAPVDFFRFRLRDSGGNLIASFHAPGNGWSLQINPERRLQRHLADAAARINNALTAYATPLTVDPTTNKYPVRVVGINARMAARSAVASMTFENAAYRVARDVVMGMEAADEATLAEWVMGKPINPAASDQTSVADDAMRATNRYSAPRPRVPWIRGSL